MAGNRTDTCATCFFYDYHRDSSRQLGQVYFNLANPTIVVAPARAPIALNQPIVLSLPQGGILPSPFQLNTPYYVIPNDVNTFQLSATVGGMPIVITNIGSGPDTFFQADYAIMGCHFGAPDPGKDIGGAPATIATWQPVNRDYWCGQFLLTYPSSVASFTSWASVLGNTGAGAYSVAAITALFAVIGKAVFFEVEINITNAGTATGNITFTLPTIPAVDTAIMGFDKTHNWQVTGMCPAGSNVATIFKYDSTSEIASGNVIALSGTYDTQ